MSTIYIDGAVWQAEDKVVEYIERLEAKNKRLREALEVAHKRLVHGYWPTKDGELTPLEIIEKALKMQ